MCGRVTVKTTLAGLMAAFSEVSPGDIEAMGNGLPRWNGAPGQDYPLIIQEPDVAGPVFMRAKWGFIPGWMKEPKGGPKPANAKAETIAANGMFKNAYRSRRALMPIHGYFEWHDVHATGKNKQPYAIAMKEGTSFALAAIWEGQRGPESGLEERTFAVLTCEANDMIASIHDRMPVILAPADYKRWLSDMEPDPRDLLRPFPSELMRMWPISTKVNRPVNDTPDILNPDIPD